MASLPEPRRNGRRRYRGRRNMSKLGEEFEGGELLLVEQQPRAQSVGHSIRLEQGEAVAITTRYRLPRC
jgi:hypothetical protein